MEKSSQPDPGLLPNGSADLSSPGQPSSVQLRVDSDDLPHLVWKMHDDGTSFYYNRRWLDYTGKAPDESKVPEWHTVCDATELPAVLERWRSARESGDPFEDVFALRRHDGVPRRHLTRALPVRDVEGGLLYWVATSTDVEDLLGKEQESREIRQRFEFCVRAGKLGIFHCAYPWDAIEWDAQCKEHFFLPPDAQIDFALFYSLIHPDDLEHVKHSISQTTEEGKPYDVRYRCLGPAKQVRWIRAKGHCYKDAAGCPLRFDGITLDITDEVRQAEERAALLQSEQSARIQAEHASRMKDEFLATLSHELRTPLSSVLGWSQILRQQIQDDEYAEGLAVIERNAKVQLRLIEDLLDVSRIVSGKLVLESAEVELKRVVERAAETFVNAARAKGILLMTSLQGGEEAKVLGDAERLQQVVWNLLSNAVKFTPAGGAVEVSLQKASGQIEISVLDSGPGIEPGFLPYIFDRFRQSDSSTTRKYGGLGLGMALAKQLVELHGGRIRAMNRVDQSGALFVVTLPIFGSRAVGRKPRFNESDTAGRIYAEQPALNLAVLEGLRILIVDDDDDIRSMLSRILQTHGVEVHSAASARQALHLMCTCKLDAIISDIGMPEEDGFTLIARVRALEQEEACSLPAVALTAFARDEDRKKVLASGFQAHLTKPIDIADLVATLGAVTGRISA